MAYRGKYDARYRNNGNPSPVIRSSEPRQAAPVRETPRPAAPAKRRGPRTGGVIFYTIYFLIIIGFFGGMYFVNDWLTGWLIDFEAKQPTTKSQETFEALFTDPDWAKLYEMANIQDTLYEGKEEFVAYMEEKIGDAELTYQETSAGLSGDKKFFVKNGDETIGYFTLADNRAFITDMPEWELGEVNLLYSYDKSVTVQKTAEQIIYVNGVALDDSHVIQMGTTLAENYLPRGLHGPRIYTVRLTGLMCEPEVTATDANGNPVDISYNEETGLYVAQTSVNTASDEFKTLAYNTAKAYSLRMINQTHQMGKYFDTSSDSYKTIVETATFMQTWFYRSHKFGDASYSGYYRYSDSLFSIHVKLPMYVTRTDGTDREYNVDHTFFFEKQNGNWKCIVMTNVDVQQQKATVRLTFTLDGAVLSSEFFAADAKEVIAPAVTAPEGKEFIGWFREGFDENGNKTMNFVFAPGEDGKIAVPDSLTLEPMTLVALFDTAKESEAAN